MYLHNFVFEKDKSMLYLHNPKALSCSYRKMNKYIRKRKINCRKGFLYNIHKRNNKKSMKQIGIEKRNFLCINTIFQDVFIKLFC